LHLGLGAVPVHSDIVTHQEEVEMLALNVASINTPSRLNMRFGYSLFRNFFVKAAHEMR
jgi:hypothetical protein